MHRSHRVVLSLIMSVAASLWPAADASGQPPATVDTIRGLAYDSLSWQPLAGALVTADPGGELAVSDSAGRFIIVSAQRVTRLVAFHEGADRLGLGELVAVRPDTSGPWLRPIVATPGMDAVWTKLCGPRRRPGGGNGGIVFGNVTTADGLTRVAGLGLVLQWESVHSLADIIPRLETITTRSDSLGNYVFCGAQDFGPAAVTASSAEWQTDNVLIESSPSSLRRRDLIVGPRSGAGAFATVSGRVVDETGSIVQGATVNIGGFAGEIQSGPNGRFTLTGVPTGSRMLTVRRVGFMTNAIHLDLAARGVTDLVIAIERSTSLETVVTREERPLSRDARELDERRLVNKGRFLDSAYFVGYGSTRQALAAAPGLRPQVGRTPSDFVLRGRGDCLMALWVNGVREENEFDNLFTRIPKDAIAAVEIYPSENVTPVRFQTIGNSCGVVLVWTKAHINARP